MSFDFDKLAAFPLRNRGLADPEIKQRFAEMGVLIVPGSPEDFGKMTADETAKWGKAVKFANVSED